MRLSFIFFSILISSAAFAHRDTGIKLQKSGQLIGFPKEYLPATFELENFALSIANNKLTLPECVSKFLVNNKLSFSSSWYHTRSTLPPYFNIKASSYSQNIEYTFMLNMDTLELIDAYQLPLNRSTAGIRYSLEPIELPASCVKIIRGSLVE
ncbi:hypothetical protein [Pseudoalteromonas maricaloris]|uniref:hypothetical protein n=1 Tax=Pseudoalteromonas maricaloris TaxID=184924 RepID=UPI00057CEFFC|nr:hypothetical protein [Pseudoalteromonas flavipulchra]KID33722.1 hypothetical protein QT15_18745 [Pseudoalteromonas flavipulchra NCIMB 2033 = ATCC BAA-314]KJZ03164.1 hypothetical protein TW73_09400 [Pseudoalteromonas piscicida]MBE0375799.1 hypothetical protein [Pseudoalteromonas flavipulchra NCIMB 2033 = ATCC BAA-314]